MNFRDYAVSEIVRHLSDGKNTVLVSPTGSGKTRMATRILGGNTVTWTAHRSELCEQAATELRGMGFQVQHLGDSKVKIDNSCQIFVSTIQSLLLRSELPHSNLVVWDECHHGPADSWRLLPVKLPPALYLGLTATPERADGRPLGDLFHEMVVAAYTPDLIRDGHLVQPYVYRPRHPLDRVLAISPLDAVRYYSNGEPTFVYVNRVTKAYDLYNELSAIGIKSHVIEHNTDASSRKMWFKAFGDGKVQVMISVDALTEGVDAPRAACAIIARTIASSGMMIQVCGRVLRPFNGKTHARVIDLTGSTYRCGLPDDYYTFSLTGKGISVGPRGNRDPAPERTPSVAELDIVGEPLLAVGSAPPVHFMPAQATEESRWLKFLREGQAAGMKRAKIAALYFRKFGEFPPLPNGVQV